jgi:serine/threonine-protein kinase
MSSESAATGSRRAVRIGKYEVLAHVATGGMGAIYRALDTEENREVALKVLTPDMAARPAMLERFRREGRHAVKMRHENIVTVYEFNELNGTYYIAMEFVEGIDLHDYIDQNGPLDPEESRQMVLQAARALAHAHALGIVHRDIKPSNFLVTRKNNRVVIKLTDLGLAREAQAEEFRVTRAGTTVGTVDYISPEQARDSGSADIRSDIYSLGCTWYHMLAGHPPFPEGGLAERLYKHMEAEPPDIRDFNPRVSRQLAEVLSKMLAKKPSDRFQDPTELLQALNEMTAVAREPVRRETATEVNTLTTPDTGLPARKPSSGRKDSGAAKKRSGASGLARRAAQRRRRLIYLACIAASVVVVGAVALVFFLNRNKTPPAQPDVAVKEKDRDRETPQDPIVKPPIVKPDPDPDPTPVASKSRFKPLYKPSEKVDVRRLREEVEKPWAKAAPLPETTPVLRVSRVPDGNGNPAFTSVEDACKSNQAPADGPVIIEINDNGPLYEAGGVIEGRQVVLRAGKGYRPLLVWDYGRGKSPTFIKVTKGSLTLENLDVAVRVPDNRESRWTLFHAVESDLTATGCTFSEAGKGRDAVVLARFEGTRCRFTSCFARGSQLVALELNAPGAEVLLDGCLVVGGEQPLLQVAGGTDKPASLRVVRSTLVSSQTMLHLQGRAGSAEPALNWFGWDALLCRAHRDYGGQMLTLDAGLPVKAVRWRAVNCLYAGWGSLLSGPQAVGGDNGIQEWQRLWGLTEGDEVRRLMWPKRENLNTETHRAEDYRPDKNPEVGVASTLSGDLPIGCDIDALPPTRKEWLRLVPDRIAAATITAPGDGGPPDIPRPEGPLFAGEKVDLSLLYPPDLGLYLKEQKERQKFAEKVVLHLHNAGTREFKFTPFSVPAGTSLTIYYEPKGDKPEDRQPLKLEVSTANPANGEAVLATEGGALDLTNIEFRLPELSGKFPPVLLKAHGDLRLHRCRLFTASETKTPPGFKALIDFFGSDEETADKPNLVLSQSVLVSYKESTTCVRVFGPGAGLLFNQSMLVAAGDCVSFHFGEDFDGRANVQCFLQNSTLCPRRAAVALNRASWEDAVVEPVFVRSKDCAFVDPFPGNHTPGILRASNGALGQGLLLWQSDGDALDRRLNFVASSAAVVPSKSQRQAQELWERLWGSQSVRDLVKDANWPQLTFDADRPWAMNLDRLEIPPIKSAGAKERSVGVKIADLGVTKKKRP